MQSTSDAALLSLVLGFKMVDSSLIVLDKRVERGGTAGVQMVEREFLETLLGGEALLRSNG